MAIVNRDLDASQQVDVLNIQLDSIGVSALVALAVLPYPCTIQSLKYAATGLSGSPIWTFAKQSIGTTVLIGISGMVIQAMGTSGSVGFSGLAAAGSTLLNLGAGDILYVTSSVANTAVDQMALQIAVKKTQDIVSYN